MSKRRHSASQLAISSRNNSADANVWTRNPCTDKRRLRPCSMLGSSSTTAMVCMRLPIQMKQHANLPTIGNNRQSDANESPQPNVIPESLHVGTSLKIGWRVAWPVRAVLHHVRRDAMQNPT